MSDTGFAKAGFNHILDSLVLPGNTNDHLAIKKITCMCRTTDRPIVPQLSKCLKFEAVWGVLTDQMI